MTRRLKIAAQLLHPSLGQTPLWPDNLGLTPPRSAPPRHEMHAYPIVQEPPLPVNWKRGRRWLFSAKQRQPVNRSGAAPKLLVGWVFSAARRGSCHCCVTVLERLKALSRGSALFCFSVCFFKIIFFVSLFCSSCISTQSRSVGPQAMLSVWSQGLLWVSPAVCLPPSLAGEGKKRMQRK